MIALNAALAGHGVRREMDIKWLVIWLPKLRRLGRTYCMEPPADLLHLVVKLGFVRGDAHRGAKALPRQCRVDGRQ
jgi:hypothetical protein